MQLVTIKEVSAFLKVKESTLYSWVSSGLIPSYKANGLIRFDIEEIQDWIKKSRTLPAIAQRTIKKVTTKVHDVNRLVKKAIDDVTGKGYNPSNGKPGPCQGLGKEVV